jgi:hypothetical protein
MAAHYRSQALLGPASDLCAVAFAVYDVVELACLNAI